MKIKNIIFDMHGVLFDYSHNLDCPVQPIKPGIELLAQAKQLGYTLFGCTNWKLDAIKETEVLYPEIMANLQAVVCPDISGYKKPHHKMFEFMVDTYGILPDQTIFLDDSMRNVEAARECGMHALHVHDFVILKAELQKMSII